MPESRHPFINFLRRAAPLVGAASFGVIILGLYNYATYLKATRIDPPAGQSPLPKCSGIDSRPVKKGYYVYITNSKIPELKVLRRHRKVNAAGDQTGSDDVDSPPNPPEVNLGIGYHHTTADFDATPFLKNVSDRVLVTLYLDDGERFVSGNSAITSSDAEHIEMFCVIDKFREDTPKKSRSFYILKYNNGTNEIIGSYWIHLVSPLKFYLFGPVIIRERAADPNVRNTG